jgi:type IV pilus assembly protein PilO
MNKQIQQLVVMVILLGLCIFLFVNFLVQPKNTEIEQAKQKRLETRARLVEMQQRALELPKLEAEMQVLKFEVEGLEKQLPRDAEIPELIRMITRTAQKYSIKVTNIAPPVKPVEQPNYNELPFEITLQGSYHALANFLADLGSEARILNARNVKMSVQSQSKDSSNTINVNFTLVAFTFRG